MSESRRPAPWPRRLAESIPLRMTLYYAGLVAVAVALDLPVLEPVAAAAPPPDVTGPLGPYAPQPRGIVAGTLAHPALAVGAAAGAAFLLALPVAWVYMLTREKKGYRQTVVHTLVLLPMVVAGVAVLVKDSVALALSVAGIAAAVRFRNTLDDAKDAVYLLLSLAIGLGAGADVGVAFALSAIFNFAAVVIFYTDFGRTPPALEGERAQRQLERAIAIANRTSEFVARVDEAVLRELAPPQLDALAQRLRRRREESAGDLPPNPDVEFDARLRIVTTDPTAVRTLVEPVLASRVKRWSPEGMGERDDDEEDGRAVVGYRVRWRKGTSPETVLAAVREEGAPFVVHAELLR